MQLLQREHTRGLEERRTIGFRLHDNDTADGPLWPAQHSGIPVLPVQASFLNQSGGYLPFCSPTEFIMEEMQPQMPSSHFAEHFIQKSGMYSLNSSSARIDTTHNLEYNERRLASKSNNTSDL
jgi:hypothetical protein